jgi:hypothetical protein
MAEFFQNLPGASQIVLTGKNPENRRSASGHERSRGPAGQKLFPDGLDFGKSRENDRF